MATIETIYVVNHSHTDIGFTDHQDLCFRQHREFIDQAMDLMDATADAMASHGLATHFTFTRTEWFWLVGRWHAETLAGAGWTRARIQQYVWERAWRTRAELKRLGALRGDPEPGDEAARVLAAARPEDIFLVRAGGESGIYSTLIKVYIGMPATTVRVGARHGRPSRTLAERRQVSPVDRQVNPEQEWLRQTRLGGLRLCRLPATQSRCDRRLPTASGRWRVDHRLPRHQARPHRPQHGLHA